MGLLKLSSYIDEKTPNDNLGFIIRKNPKSTPFLKRAVRKGEATGFYPKDTHHEYITHFRDFSEVSFTSGKTAEGENSYLNPNQYHHPMIYNNILQEFFAATMKEHLKEDLDTNMNTIYISSIKLNNFTMNILNKVIKYFPDISIKITPITNQIYSIQMSGKVSMYFLMNFCYLSVVFIACLLDLLENYELGILEKICKCMNIINAPYYMRYIIASYMISKKQFEQLKPELEKIPNHKVSMTYGRTQDQRYNAIIKYMDFKRCICDIGCGEGYYATKFSSMLEKSDSKLVYYALDTDEKEIAKLDRKIKSKEITNIKTYTSMVLLESDLPEESVDIIITEVIEHMGKEQSTDFITYILNNLNCNKIVITTPNFGFNKHYLLGNEFEEKYRHDDHKWEPTQQEFVEFMEFIFKNLDVKDFEHEYLKIGDMIDGEPCTQGVLIRKKQLF
jgi:2-polyprenyl-3-methyl-5-hydroxy-6-metoxy-1,4-benzoquinol methylase